MMEVPDWGDASQQDYPSLLTPAGLPASDNARKKAKRKRKQQQEHLRALIDEPVHLGLSRIPSGDSLAPSGLHDSPAGSCLPQDRSLACFFCMTTQLFAGQMKSKQHRKEQEFPVMQVIELLLLTAFSRVCLSDIPPL